MFNVRLRVFASQPEALPSIANAIYNHLASKGEVAKISSGMFVAAVNGVLIKVGLSRTILGVPMRFDTHQISLVLVLESMDLSNLIKVLQGLLEVVSSYPSVRVEVEI
ncbi:MAG TPA: hypothetical protein EYP48_02635 [Ignisphaera sp.]|uniref:Uncharacterized protein n=1 Tax=Ignisphaera aggregans TaxID=334771 RepID=A0A832YXP9_9CREN|nr:hypothetical protein [Ignisphaera sp.]HIP57013.1 hypothetical protein [Ignisphaera aggregans]